MEAPFDFWPFGSSQGFALVFVVLALALLGGARLAQTLLGARAAAARTDDTADAPGGALALDVLPRAQDMAAVAWLRGGESAVAETLLAAALAAGWLYRKDGALALLADATPRDAADRLLLDEIGRQPLTIAGAVEGARRAAAQLAPAQRARLERAALLHTSLSLAVARLLPIGAVVVLWLAIEAHVAVRTAHDGAAPTSPWLVGALVFVALAGVALAVRVDRRTPRARDFLQFLEESTAALREDVRAQRATDVADVKLTVALDGLRAVPWHPLAAPLAERTSSALATALRR